MGDLPANTAGHEQSLDLSLCTHQAGPNKPVR